MYGVYMTWKDRLQDASFAVCRLRLKKKVREPVVVWNARIPEPRQTLYRRPGENHFRPSITAYVVGDDCFDQRDRLLTR